MNSIPLRDNDTACLHGFQRMTCTVDALKYDDSIVRQMVECIKVYPGGKLEIIFGGGYLVEESV